MTIFQTESFKLDLTYLNVKFSEENSFFVKDLIKQYSFPFKVSKERNTLAFFEFIYSHHSISSNKFVKGTLFKGDKYYDAELMVVSIGEKIEVVIYYDFDELSIFDQNLRDLPWPTIDCGDDIYAYAEDRIVENIDDTMINFGRVYSPELYRDYDWGVYVPYINYNQGNRISETDLDPANFVFKKYLMNEIRPFIYLKEVVKFIFDQINYTVSGDFMSSSAFSKALLYHQNHIYYTNDKFEIVRDIAFTLISTSPVGKPAGIREYRQEVLIQDYGTYSIDINVTYTIPDTNGGRVEINLLWDNKLIGGAGYTSDPGDHSESHSYFFHVDKSKVGSKLIIQIFCKDNVDDSIEGDFKINGTLRPLYHNQIQLNQLLPNLTVGEFITKLKESLVLTSIFDTVNNTVHFNYYRTYVNDAPIVDLTKYAHRNVIRKLNRSTGYRLEFNDGEVINLDKQCQIVSSERGFESMDISMQPLPIIYNQPLGSGFGANVQDQDGLSIFFYEANQFANPLASLGQVSFSRIGFVTAYLRGWYYQQLNGEEYNQTIELPIHISSKLSTNSKVWIYDNEFMIKKINRSRSTAITERVVMDLFKIKPHPTFNIAIDDNPGDDVIPQNPVIKITAISNPNGTAAHQSSYTATASSVAGNPAVFGIVFYANGSSDPNNLQLNYGWQVLSSPGGLSNGRFVSQNSDHSITRFSHQGFFNVSGTYSIKLTVTNSEGGVSTSTITLMVS